MAEEIDPFEELRSWEDIAYSNMVQNEAILRLLLKKEIITKEEFIEESQKVHQAFQENKASNS